jgi:hypothetical protein
MTSYGVAVTSAGLALVAAAAAGTCVLFVLNRSAVRAAVVAKA